MKKYIGDIIVAIIVIFCFVFIVNGKLIVISCILDHNYFNKVVFEEPCYGRCGASKISMIQALEYYANSMDNVINTEEIIMYLMLGIIPIIFVVIYILFIRKQEIAKRLIYLGINMLVCTILFTLFWICYQVLISR